MKLLQTSQANSQFKEHLNIPNNSRIFFSGPFGSGKTTFLKNYFNPDSEGDEEYQVFHLFPINYQVGDNKDVFEYLKFDLIYSLMIISDLSFDELKLSPVFKITDFAVKNAGEILTPFLNLIPKVGGGIYKVMDKLNSLKEKYKTYYEEFEFDDFEKVRSYLEKFNSESKGPYEDDFYSQIIRQLIDQVKEKGKSTVLILDDLDRIDPDHIFRLLNIFDAHVDRIGDGNKFGFDKIVLVGDINNVKAIFHQKFGQRADFVGYINKFYSNQVFHFNIQNVVEKGLESIFHEINFIYLGKSMPLGKGSGQAILTSNIIYIIGSLIKEGQLTLRQLKEKFSNNYEAPLINYIGDKLKKRPVGREYQYTYGYAGIVLIEFICHIYENDIDLLLRALDSCRDYDWSTGSSIGHHSFLEVILPILAYDEFGFTLNDEETISLELKNEKGSWSIDYQQSHWLFDTNYVIVGKVNVETVKLFRESNFNYLDHLQSAIKVCRKNGFI